MSSPEHSETPEEMCRLLEIRVAELLDEYHVCWEALQYWYREQYK